MSRIGFAPISVADNVTVDIGSNNIVTVKGPKGELTLQVNPEIVLSLEDSEVVVKRPTEQKRQFVRSSSVQYSQTLAG